MSDWNGVGGWMDWEQMGGLHRTTAAVRGTSKREKEKEGEKKQEGRCALLVIGKAKLDRKKQITMIIAINKKPKPVRIIVWTMEGRGNTRVQARGAEKGGKKEKTQQKKQNKKGQETYGCV